MKLPSSSTRTPLSGPSLVVGSLIWGDGTQAVGPWPSRCSLFVPAWSGLPTLCGVTTTTGNGVLALLHPDLSLIPGFVEEALRLEGVSERSERGPARRVSASSLAGDGVWGRRPRGGTA